MNITYLIIGIAVVLILLLIVLVIVGLNRKKSKTVSFEKVEEAPKELTQQEKSGNYQAAGGFNFAPAKTEEKEPELLEGQLLSESVQRDNLAEAAEAQELKYVDEQEPVSIAEPVAPEPAEPEFVAPEPAAVETETVEEIESDIAPEPAAVETETVEEIDTDIAPEPAVAEAEVETVEEIDTDIAPEPEFIAPEAAEPELEAEPEDLPPHEAPVIPEPVEIAEPLEHQESTFSLDGAAQASDYSPAVAEPVAERLEELAEEPELKLESQEEVAQEDATQELVEEQERVEEEATEAAAAASVTAEAAEAALEQTPVPTTVPAEAPAPAEVEDIAPAAGRIGRLRGRLSRSQNVIGQGVLGILTAGDLDEDAWEEIEDTLLMADLGTTVTMNVVDSLRDKIAERGVSSEAEARTMLRETLIEACHPEMDRAIRAMPYQGKPAVILIVGVNGTGKTTTTGKLARVLVSMGHKVLLGAADTFRAAAADQLETWGRRVGATTVRGAEGADPASVAFDAVAKGVEEQADVVLVDTAGRLHTATGLMDQLGKVKRVVEKKAVVDEVILVLDATVGQNGLTQARVFRDVVDITGVALTKLDGTAKGGIVFQVQEELGVPVKLVGLGEGADDLAPFEVEGFVDALLGTK
ncbi:signal recognition particle-docking protein FtsY [Corynebacterium nasicanis]|uniref:Signal recognition particle receptor FtsY n=2 Tax=Corynebacterium nasicanis TaxID=1448267 RepID=A0ABW1QAY1_9CORY